MTSFADGWRPSTITMTTGWRAYFTMCPDYWIRVRDSAPTPDATLMTGDAGGTIDGTPWRVPAAWRIVIRAGLRHPRASFTREIVRNSHLRGVNSQTLSVNRHTWHANLRSTRRDRLPYAANRLPLAVNVQSYERNVQSPTLNALPFGQTLHPFAQNRQSFARNHLPRISFNFSAGLARIARLPFSTIGR
jgi:hypothetical protein